MMHERLGLKRAQYEEMAPLIAGMVGEPPVPVPDRLVPMMVTFRDVADPASVMGVARTPEEAAEKGWALPSEAFGAGVRLAGVTMAVVREPITRGRVDQLLPWLGPDPEPSILPSVASDDFSVEAKLRHGDFRTVIP